MVSIDLRETSGVVLAYLGDSVWELYVREYFILKGYNIRNLNKHVVNSVNAKTQSRILKNIIENVDEKYKQLINRSKNGNIKTFPRSCSVTEYREATGFEAYIGALYIDGNIDKIKEIIKENLDGEDK
ncbi:Mini-ribonuclease 3-like protein [Fusobacterium perfoetens]|uniref:Mini-ribonuclease 3 n=1 Tax=Fusobacterium perfoetens TaxID=852 RepID=UPI0015A330CB|nr:ribonuclease III domain-containing protein [Fusobacterium perfoetens]MCF2625718.1 Mini-ribonuclease 3-like protein [Fusobacterium perfoetens]